MHACLNILRLAGAATAATLIVIGAVTGAYADDYDRLQTTAGASKWVSVIATGWQSLGGDDDGTMSAGNGSDWDALDGNELVRELKAKGAQIDNIRTYRLLPAVAMSVAAKSLNTVKNARPGMKLYEDRLMRPSLRGSGRMMRVPAATANGYTGKGQIIAVIDSGVDTTHPFFNGRIAGELCFSDRCANGKTFMAGKGAAMPNPKIPGFRHGTHVAGISLGRAEKFSGVAPDASLLAINAYTTRGGFRTRDIWKALEVIYFLVKDKGQPIVSVNMSLGADTCDLNGGIADGFAKLANYLKSVNVAVIAASGNAGLKSLVGRPACFPGIISVGATDKNWKVTPYSNSGKLLDLLAPGGDSRLGRDQGILSSVPGGKFAGKDGTSMAAPQVAGAFAVLRQAVPGITVDRMLAALKHSGRPIRDINGLSRPGIDLMAALAHLGVRVGPKPMPQPPGSPEKVVRPTPRPAPAPKPAPRNSVPRPTPQPVPAKPAPPKKEKDWETL